MSLVEWFVAEGRWEAKARNHLEAQVTTVAWPEDDHPLKVSMYPFAVAKMLHEGQAPDAVRRTISSFPLPCGLSLRDAMNMRWQEVLFPLCTETGKPGVGYLELGLLPEAAENDALDARLSPDIAAAITRALQHARRKTDCHYACWLRNVDYQALSGPSLALPVYLAALWLGRDCTQKSMNVGDPSDLLATGDIDDDGNLLPVGGIREKSQLLHENYPFAFSAFLFPASKENEVDLDEGQFYPVYTPEDAAAITSCRIRNPSFWQDILRIHKDHGHFWDVLGHNLTDEEAEFLWRQAIRLRLIDPSTALDNTQLKQLSEFIDQRRILVVAASEILTPQWALLQPVSAAAYKLCSIFQTNASQRGSSDAEAWAASTKQHLPAAEELNGSAENMHNKVRCLGSHLHNRYVFDPNDKDIASLAEYTHEFAPLVVRKLLGKTDRIALGETYGFLCQHFAFCGDNRQALDYADRALRIFAEGCGEEAADHKKRILCYKAYVLWDNGENAAAARVIRERDTLEGKPGEDSYTLSLEARAAFEAGKTEKKLISLANLILDDFQEYRRLPLPHRNGKTAGGRTFGHPWQLFFWNMGRMPEMGNNRERCLRMAYTICCPWDYNTELMHSDASTAVSSGCKATSLIPMALLPLSQLAADADTRRKVDAVLRCMRAMVDADTLSPNHFAEVLDAAGPEEALGVVRQRMTQLFPFNYR